MKNYEPTLEILGVPIRAQWRPRYVKAKQVSQRIAISLYGGPKQKSAKGPNSSCSN